jgi:hypothetical protein
MRLTIDHRTANGGLMMTEQVKRDVISGIDNPSDAVIPYGATLYRTSHARRYNKSTGAYDANGPDAGYESGWWSMSDDFLGATWFSGLSSYSNAARQAFAIHPAWRSDCSNVSSISPQCDLSAWYGIGKAIEDIDPATGKTVRMEASQNILQIYIPGFRDNHQKWARFGKTVPFGS